MQKETNDKRLDEFVHFLISEEKSKATVEKYRRDAGAFISFLGEEEVSKEKVVSYKEKLMEKGYTIRSINSMIAGINKYLLFIGRGDCRVRSIKLQREFFCPEKKELTKEEYLRLVDAAASKPRLCLLLQTICSTGIRVSELRYFTMEAIRSGEIRVLAKGKCRTVLLPGKLRKRLMDYAKKQGITSGPLFRTRSGRALDRSNIWTAMKELCVKASVEAEKVFPHNLRKLFARIFYRQSKDIAKLADILGHSSINTTRIYIVSTGKEHRRMLENLCLIQ